MLSRPYSAAILGVDGHPICVECSVSNGISDYQIVGLPDNAVKEAKERITSAIYNSGYMMPFGNILVNIPNTSYNFSSKIQLIHNRTFLITTRALR